MNSAASLLQGDELAIDVRLRDGAVAAVHSVAAQVVHPSPAGLTSQVAVNATLVGASSLRWLVEPTILRAECRLVTDATIDMDADCDLMWREELVLPEVAEHQSAIGSSERPTVLDTATMIDVAGQPRWRDGLCTDPGFDGPAILGANRYSATMVAIGGHADGLPDGVWHPIASGGRWCRVLSTDPVEGRRSASAAVG